jgi:hypothetical protein
MQARLTYIRFPLTLVALFFVIAAALLLGGVLGYEFRPTPVIPAPRVIIEGTGPAAAPSCVRADNHKAC